MITAMALVTTAEAAKQLGVATRTLQRWAADGLVTPDLVTPGGHQRWDVERLREQLREIQERDK
jgi:excisionase family DNA binding protein